MRIVRGSQPKMKEPLVRLGRYECRSCKGIFDVESMRDIPQLEAKPSWISLENSTSKLLEVLCPCCNKRTDCMTVTKGWFG